KKIRFCEAQAIGVRFNSEKGVTGHPLCSLPTSRCRREREREKEKFLFVLKPVIFVLYVDLMVCGDYSFLRSLSFLFTMGKSPAKWVKNILRGKKSSKSYPSKAADEKNSPSHPQPSSKESIATSTVSNLAPQTTTTETNSEPGQLRNIIASTYENDTPVAANQTNESCATEFSSSKEAENLVLEEEAGSEETLTNDNLKGINMLQALIRGHLVRRQASATLHCVMGIVKLQAVARGRMIRHSYNGLQVRLKCSFKEAEVTETSTISSSSSLGRQSSNAFASKILASSVSSLPLNLQYDLDEPNSAPKWLERWSSSHFWGSAAHQKEAAVSSNSQLQGNKAAKSESSAPRNEARKVATTRVENNLPHSSLDNGKPKRNNRKHPVQHVETVQDNPENELERVKKSLRKISLSNKEAAGKPESPVEMPKKTPRNVSVTPTPDPKTKSEAATEELHKSNSEKLDMKEHVLTDSFTDETKPSDVQPQKPEMEAELDSPVHDLSHQNGIDAEKPSFANEENVPKEENSLDYDHKSRRRSVPAKQEYYDQNPPQNARTVPSYMAATASAKAKLRGLGSSKVSDQEGEEDAAIRRHSLPSSTNGKLSSMSPRVQKVTAYSNGKDRSRNDKSLSSSRDEKYSSQIGGGRFADISSDLRNSCVTGRQEPIADLISIPNIHTPLAHGGAAKHGGSGLVRPQDEP
ncbi:hypothetical protein V2J09_024169, partial [Rumex salicifolius]